MKRPNKPVSPEEFIKVWQTTATRKEVAEKLKMNANACSQRAANYRNQGIRLKKLTPPGRAGLDLKKLSALAAKYRKD